MLSGSGFPAVAGGIAHAIRDGRKPQNQLVCVLASPTDRLVSIAIRQDDAVLCTPRSLTSSGGTRFRTCVPAPRPTATLTSILKWDRVAEKTCLGHAIRRSSGLFSIRINKYPSAMHAHQDRSGLTWFNESILDGPTGLFITL